MARANRGVAKSVGVEGFYCAPAGRSNRWPGCTVCFCWFLHGDRGRLSIGRDPFVLSRSPRSREPIGWYRGLDHAAASRRRKLSPRFAGTHGEGGIPRGNRLHPIHVGNLHLHALTLAHTRPESNLMRVYVDELRHPLSSVHPSWISLTLLLYLAVFLEVKTVYTSVVSCMAVWIVGSLY